MLIIHVNHKLTMPLEKLVKYTFMKTNKKSFILANTKKKLKKKLKKIVGRFVYNISKVCEA